MAISKPKKQDVTAEQPPADEKKIAALISKGGSSTGKKSSSAESDEDARQALRVLPFKSQLREIEKQLSQTPKRERLSRHAWILQAIDEKLQRDNKKLK